MRKEMKQRRRKRWRWRLNRWKRNRLLWLRLKLKSTTSNSCRPNHCTNFTQVASWNGFCDFWKSSLTLLKPSSQPWLWSVELRILICCSFLSIYSEWASLAIKWWCLRSCSNWSTWELQQRCLKQLSSPWTSKLAQSNYSTLSSCNFGARICLKQERQFTMRNMLWAEAVTKLLRRLPNWSSAFSYQDTIVTGQSKYSRLWPANACNCKVSA